MTWFCSRRAVSILAAGGTCLAALAVAAAPAHAAPRGAAAPALAAPPGSNLLVNAGAEAGAASQQGWDAVTIPGWQVARGLPTVVGYGTRGFPGRADAGTRGRGRQLFAGGAGGPAVLTQRVPLRTRAGRGVPAGTRFRISGWLGGTVVSKAELEVVFLSGRPGSRLQPHRPGRRGRGRQPPRVRLAAGKRHGAGGHPHG
jgi:hypothetical protein